MLTTSNCLEASSTRAGSVSAEATTARSKGFHPLNSPDAQPEQSSSGFPPSAPPAALRTEPHKDEPSTAAISPLPTLSHHSLDRAIDHLSRLLTHYLDLGHLQQVVVYRSPGPGLNGTLLSHTHCSPDIILLRKALDRIILSRRVTRDDRTMLLAIARLDFIPTATERDLIDKIFRHISTGLIKVMD